jgi:hypothetical protein
MLIALVSIGTILYAALAKTMHKRHEDKITEQVMKSIS